MQFRLYPEDAGLNSEMFVFRSSKLGKMHSLIPFEKICNFFRPHLSKSPQGAKAWLSLEGGLALMFLKSYAGCISDADLIERLNSNYQFQLFCGIRLCIISLAKPYLRPIVRKKGKTTQKNIKNRRLENTLCRWNI